MDAQVIVVGAGPVGLMTALQLVRYGILVLVLEASDDLQNSPRAAVYRGPAVLELARSGILDEVRSEGIQTTDVSWRKVDGEVLAVMDSKDVFPHGHPNSAVTLGQYDLARLIQRHLKAYPCVLHFSHKVNAIEQDNDGVMVTAETPNGKASYRAEYLACCDGGRSACRKILDISFNGFMFDYPIIANNVYYDFRKQGYSSANFIVDPKHWALICALDKTGLWRVSYGEEAGLTEAELTDPKRVASKFDALFPGPKPLDYKVMATSMYRMHQRACENFKKGRCLLAGDAARINNPYGGLGLTGGILDAGALADALRGVIIDGEPDDLLQDFADTRREIFLKYNNVWSQDNVKLLFETDPATAKDHPFFKMINNQTHEEKIKAFTADHVIRDSMFNHYRNKEKANQRRVEEAKVLQGFIV